MQVKFLLLIAMLVGYNSYAQPKVKPSYTIVNTEHLIPEERAGLRIALAHIEGSTITAYRQKDKSFYITSFNDNSLTALRSKVGTFYPKAVVSQTGVSEYGTIGFVEVINRIILSDPTFPVYIETGDHQLDETSYQYEKSDWQQKNPNSHK